MQRSMTSMACSCGTPGTTTCAISVMVLPNSGRMLCSVQCGAKPMLCRPSFQPSATRATASQSVPSTSKIKLSIADTPHCDVFSYCTDFRCSRQPIDKARCEAAFCSAPGRFYALLCSVFSGSRFVMLRRLMPSVDMLCSRAESVGWMTPVTPRIMSMRLKLTMNR